MSIFELAKTKLLDLFKGQSGNVAITFALTSLVIVGVAGSAVDYTRMYNAKSDYQNAADAAALTAAIMYRTESWANANRNGQDHFNESITEVDATLQQLSINLADDESNITVDAGGMVQSTILGVLGYEGLGYSVRAVVDLPDYPIEVTMVLDTTFSMSVDGKIATLKTTAKEFVDTLLQHDFADVKISIVPFAQYVNVGRHQMGQPWLDAQDEVIVTPRQCSTRRDIISKRCSTSTTNHPRQWIPESCRPAQYNDGVQVSPASCTPGHWRDAYSTSSESCTNINYGPEYEVCTPETTQTIYWNGCVASRNHDFNLRDFDFSRKVPGPNQLICPSEITPLTDNKNQLKQAINALNTVGETYIPQGIAWGARTLSSREPYGEAMTDAVRTAQDGKRYLILMTDGVNSKSAQVPSSPLHNGTDVDQSNDWTEEACDFAKADDIEVFTVAFGSAVDNATKDLLRDCATKPANFFNATQNSQLVDTFRAIANSILVVFLSE